MGVRRIIHSPVPFAEGGIRSIAAEATQDTSTEGLAEEVVGVTAVEEEGKGGMDTPAAEVPGVSIHFTVGQPPRDRAMAAAAVGDRQLVPIKLGSGNQPSRLLCLRGDNIERKARVRLNVESSLISTE
jgi:hypothetical protein